MDQSRSNIFKMAHHRFILLSEWRERALAGAATALKERERDDRDDEIARLKSKVGRRKPDPNLFVINYQPDPRSQMPHR